MEEAPLVVGAQVVVPCSGDTFAPTLSFFLEKLRFRVELITPADDPALAVIVGLGVRLRLERTTTPTTPPSLVLTFNGDASKISEQIFGGNDTVAPNGMKIVFVPKERTISIPSIQEEFYVSKFKGTGESSFKTGRAGMQYRDLIPSRLGGRFIASHIRIPNGGPVGDYVHFHKVRFQFIFCKKGWVKVVYEDQGEPFIMQSGDCVLQPPQIRHRVLECSDGLEVIEIGCPAIHDTCGDLEMELPNGVINKDRTYGGQKFVRHVASEGKWDECKVFNSFVERDTGIGAATSGLGGVTVLKAKDASNFPVWHHEGEFAFFFVLSGSITLEREGEEALKLEEADSVVIPAKTQVRWANPTEGLELLFVRLQEQLPVVVKN